MDWSKRPFRPDCLLSKAVAEPEYISSIYSHQQQHLHNNTAGLMLMTVFEPFPATVLYVVSFLSCILFVASL